MKIPFRIKLLTPTAKKPTQENEGDLWDLYADDFKSINLNSLTHSSFVFDTKEAAQINSQGRILVKTGISLELPKKYSIDKKWYYDDSTPENETQTYYSMENGNKINDITYCNFTTQYDKNKITQYAVADIRPRSGLALKHGITVLNTPGTIDNSYRKEIGVILYNAGHEHYTITKGDKIAQMLIRPLYPSSMEVVETINDTGRGGYGSTGK